MRSRRRTALAVITVALALSALSASSAFATPEWYAKKAGVFAKLTSPLEVASTFNLTLVDTDWFFGETAELPCVGKIKETLEAGGLGKINEYLATSCKPGKQGVCGEPLRAEPAHLSWKTELYSEGGYVRQRLVSGGSGTPEWGFECKQITGWTYCAFNTSSKVSATGAGNIEALFDKSSNPTTCFEKGGENAGHLEGTISSPHPAGVEALRVEEGPGEWRQGGVGLSEGIGTKWSGTVTLTNSATGVTVGCNNAGEGTAGPGAAGTETSSKASECHTTAGSCPSPTMEAVNHVWKSELALVGGTTQNLASNGKAGMPGFTIYCFGIVQDQCVGELATGMKNVTGGVSATFDGGKLTCNGTAGTGTLTGSETIEATKGSKLEVK